MTLLDITLNKLQRLFVYFIPLALVTGPFLTDVVLIMIGIFFLILSISKKEWKYYKHPLIIIFWIWCLYLILISLLSSNPLLSLETSLFHWRFGFYALGIWYVLDHNVKFLRNFTWVTSLIFTIVLIDGYFQFITGKNLLGDPYWGDRITGFFGEEQILGSFLSRMLPILFALMSITYHRNRASIIFIILILIATDVLIFLSGERSAFFYLILTTIVLIMFIKEWKKIRLTAFIVSLILVVVISLGNEPIKKRMIDKTITQTNIMGEKIKAFSIQHQIIYEAAIKIFKDNPVKGIGPKMFREICSEPRYIVTTEEDRSKLNGCSTHPHNTYVQLLSETGIIGTLPIVCIFLLVCWHLLKHGFSIISTRQYILSDFQVCLYAAVMVTLWPLVPTGNFFHNWSNAIYFLPVGFLLYSFEEN